MKIHKISEILYKLENCIVYKKPFSHIRFGDGGIKFLHSLFYTELNQLAVICHKEGFPLDKCVTIAELWGYYARRADYIDTPQVYFDNEFWPRTRGPEKPITEKTLEKLLMWPDLYYRAEFDNDSYCNPESNYLMLLRRDGQKNILDLMKGRKVAMITACPSVQYRIKEYGYTVDAIQIVGHYQNQYDNSFDNVVKIIKDRSTHYDLWLVAAGELGRVYSGIIKETGGRAIDIGFVAEFWIGKPLHSRLELYLNRSQTNSLELKLTDEGLKFAEYI
jgi:hypothetical protein